MGREGQGTPVHLGMLEPHLHASIMDEEDRDGNTKKEKERKRERERESTKGAEQKEKASEARGTTFQLEPE